MCICESRCGCVYFDAQLSLFSFCCIYSRFHRFLDFFPLLSFSHHLFFRHLLLHLLLFIIFYS
ncbi:hypothetical protein GGI35DRAFT_464605 [Trichoderma velutinum]